MNRYSWALIGGIVTVAVINEVRLRKVLNEFREAMEVTHAYMESEYQARIDEAFDDIVEDLDID